MFWHGAAGIYWIQRGPSADAQHTEQEFSYFVAWILNIIEMQCLRFPTIWYEGGRGLCWHQHFNLGDVHVCG